MLRGTEFRGLSKYNIDGKLTVQPNTNSLTTFLIFPKIHSTELPYSSDCYHKCGGIICTLVARYYPRVKPAYQFQRWVVVGTLIWSTYTPFSCNLLVNTKAPWQMVDMDTSNFPIPWDFMISSLPYKLPYRYCFKAFLRAGKTVLGPLVILEVHN